MLAVAFSSFYPSHCAAGLFICRRVLRLRFSIFHFSATWPQIPQNQYLHLFFPHLPGFRSPFFFSLFGYYFWPPLALNLPASVGAHSALGYSFPPAISPLQIYSFLSFFSIPSTLFSPRAAFLSLFL